MVTLKNVTKHSNFVLATASTLGESCHGDLYMVYRHHRWTGLLLPSSGSIHGASGSINDVGQGEVHLS